MESFTLPFEAPLVEIQRKIDELETFSKAQTIDLSKELEELRQEYRKVGTKIFSSLTDWNRVQLARHPLRPTFKFFRDNAFDEFIELFGDRHLKDDPAVRCGFARIEDRRFFVIGHFRGESTEEKIACHFGYPHPEGYRKALQKMRLAEKFGLPLVCMVNTPGAFPGREAEEHNQSEALARNIMELTQLRVPIYCVIMSEGGSGGALGIGVGDVLDMFDYAYLSVISPEGCASILWKDVSKAELAASALKCTTPHLKKFGIIDDVLPEPFCGSHKNPKEAAATLRGAILRRLQELCAVEVDDLLQRRQARYRGVGCYLESRLEAAQKKAVKKG